MSKQKNLITLGVAAVFALGLAACGGGGDGAPQTTMPEHPELTLSGVQMAMAVQAGTYRVSDDLAEALSGGDAGLLGVDHEEGTMIDIAGLMLTCGAGPCRVTVNDDGTVTIAGTIWTAGYMPPPTAAELTAAAETKEKAIATEAAQTTDAGLGGTARTDSTQSTTETTDDVYTLAISRARDEAAKIVITDPNAAGDDDPKFAMNDMGMFVRTMEADDDGNVEEEVVVVMTDIEGPKATAFAMVAGQALNADLDTTVDADNDGTVDDDLVGLWVGADATTAPTDDERGNVKSDAFAAGSGSSTVHTFARYQLDSDGTTPGNQTVQAYTTPGTYNGAMGTYRCGNVQTATDCTATVDDEGMITAMSAGWIFIPDEGATSDVPDADYLHYGFWLKKTTDEDGNVEYDEVETFAGSSIAASGDVSAVTGTATYEGGAAGVFVHSVMNPDGTRASATSGKFTADAELTATFGQTVDDPATTGVNEADQIAPALLNSITGTINNFMLSGHATGPGWSVSLEQSTNTDFASTGTFSGVAKGGGADGSYSGTFHGPVAAVDGVVPKPHTVVGEFNANFSNGSVAGGFGARKED